jgi:hypothetical protein
MVTSAPARRTATMQRGSPRLQSPLCAKSEGAGLPLCDSCIHLYPFLPFLTLEISHFYWENEKTPILTSPVRHSVFLNKIGKIKSP